MFAFPHNTLEEFKKLNEQNQIADLFAMYGYITAVFATMDNYWSSMIQGDYIFKEKTPKVLAKIDKLKKHHKEKATSGMLLKDMANIYDVGELQPLFEDIVLTRNTLAHDYMKVNFIDVNVKDVREEMYGDLLEIFFQIETFNNAIAGRWFVKKDNPEDKVRWTGH